MKVYLQEFDQKHFFSILLAFIFALPFNTLTSVNSILMGLLFLLWGFKIYDSKGTILYRTPLDFPLLGFFAWAGFSLLWTADFHESFNSWIALGKQIFLFYFIATTVKTKDQFIKIIGAFLAAMLITDVFAIIDFYQRGGNLLDRQTRAGTLGSEGDYNSLTMLIIMLLPLGFIYGIHLASNKLKTLFYVYTIITVFTFYIGYTRAGWITILFQLLIFGRFFDRKFFVKSVWTVIGILLVSFLAYSAIKQFNTLIKEPEKQIYSETLDTGNFNVRVDVWKFGLIEIFKHPFLGNGFGREIFQKVYKNNEITKPTPHLHNTLLEILFELGIPGFIFFIVCFWKILVESLKVIKSLDSIYSLYGFFMLTMVSGFIFKNLFDHMLIGNIAEIFWTLTGLLFSLRSKAVSISWNEKVNPAI